MPRRGTPGEENFDWAWMMAIFSGTVIRASASSTRSSIGASGSRYTATAARFGAGAQATAAAVAAARHSLVKWLFIFMKYMVVCFFDTAGNAGLRLPGRHAGTRSLRGASAPRFRAAALRSAPRDTDTRQSERETRTAFERIRQKHGAGLHSLHVSPAVRAGNQSFTNDTTP